MTIPGDPIWPHRWARDPCVGAGGGALMPFRCGMPSPSGPSPQLAGVQKIPGCLHSLTQLGTDSCVLGGPLGPPSLPLSQL